MQQLIYKATSMDTGEITFYKRVGNGWFIRGFGIGKSWTGPALIGMSVEELFTEEDDHIYVEEISASTYRLL